MLSVLSSQLSAERSGRQVLEGKLREAKAGLDRKNVLIRCARTGAHGGWGKGAAVTHKRVPAPTYPRRPPTRPGTLNWPQSQTTPSTHGAPPAMHRYPSQHTRRELRSKQDELLQRLSRPSAFNCTAAALPSTHPPTQGVALQAGRAAAAPVSRGRARPGGPRGRGRGACAAAGRHAGAQGRRAAVRATRRSRRGPAPADADAPGLVYPQPQPSALRPSRQAARPCRLSTLSTLTATTATHSHPQGRQGASGHGRGQGGGGGAQAGRARGGAGSAGAHGGAAEGRPGQEGGRA